MSRDAPMPWSAGKARLDGPLCIYDADGDAIAMMSERRANKEALALLIIKAVNEKED